MTAQTCRCLSSLSSSSLNRRNSSLGAYQARQGNKASSNRSPVPLQERSGKAGRGGSSSNNAFHFRGINNQENRQPLSLVKVERRQRRSYSETAIDESMYVCRTKVLDTRFTSLTQVPNRKTHRPNSKARRKSGSDSTMLGRTSEGIDRQPRKLERYSLSYFKKRLQVFSRT